MTKKASIVMIPGRGLLWYLIAIKGIREGEMERAERGERGERGER